MQFNVNINDLKNMIYFYHPVKIMAMIEWLQHCSSKPVVLEDEFNPSNVPHKTCMFNTIMFDAIAYDYMETDVFARNFSKDEHIAIYVNKVCPKCGSVKCDDEDIEIQYLKIVPNTPENRKRYQYEE